MTRAWSPKGLEIVAVLVNIPATARIVEGSFRPGGRPGQVDFDLDGSEPTPTGGPRLERPDGRPVFVDGGGTEWEEDAVVVGERPAPRDVRGRTGPLRTWDVTFRHRAAGLMPPRTVRVGLRGEDAAEVHFVRAALGSLAMEPGGSMKLWEVVSAGTARDGAGGTGGG